MCAAVTSSWEEEQEHQEGSRRTPGNDYGTGPIENQRSSGPGLASVLAVFDTLADACFTTFGDGDLDTLPAALAAVWAADGALRRVSIGARTASPMGGEWAEESRMVGFVRTLTQRCPGLPADTDTRVEQAVVGGDDGDGDGDGGGGGASGDRGGSSTEGIRASTASEDAVGGGDGAAWPVGALSLLELAGAVLDAVGPEATGEVLAACPRLLESMPPKVRVRNRICCPLLQMTLNIGVGGVVSCRVCHDRVRLCRDRLGWGARVSIFLCIDAYTFIFLCF